MSNPSFGLIAEGPTDHKILENILVGHFKDPDLTIRPLQPILDATDFAKSSGGWTQVLAYCKSSLLQGALEQNEYLIVQIDTDRLNEKPFELNLQQSVETLVNQVVEKLEAAIAAGFKEGGFEKYRTRIVYAVSVNELECWLLPLFYADKTAASTSNCLYKLNQQLGKKKLHTINPNSKNPKYYDQLSRNFCKPKILKQAAEKNPSFGIFVSALPNPEIPYPQTPNSEEP